MFTWERLTGYAQPHHPIVMEPISPPDESESNGSQTPQTAAGSDVSALAPAGGTLGGEQTPTQRLPALGGSGAQATPPGPSAGSSITEVMPAPSRSVAAGAQPSPATVTPALATAGREQCPLCTSPVAPDQRYCVECGQRLAGARPTLMNGAATQAASSSGPPPRRSRFDWGPNTTLIAGIIALLLALIAGVLIGHYAAPSGSKKPTQVVVSGLGATGTAGASAAETPAGATGGSGASKSGSSAKSGASSSSSGGASTHPSAAASKPANPGVQIGQKGHGQGYQHGEFTGHFFGSENEENAGEEGEEEGSKSGSKHK